jgi:hypothetical protein
MNADRVTGSVGLVLATVLYWLGSSASNPDAFLFPRLISIGMGLLSIAIIVSTERRTTATSHPASPPFYWITVIPVLLGFFAYPWAMETIGFYVTAFAAFLFIVSLYAPDPYSPRAIAKRVGISAAFISVIYAVFALLLRVQTPQGILI